VKAGTLEVYRAYIRGDLSMADVSRLFDEADQRAERKERAFAVLFVFAVAFLLAFALEMS